MYTEVDTSEDEEEDEEEEDEEEDDDGEAAADDEPPLVIERLLARRDFDRATWTAASPALRTRHVTDGSMWIQDDDWGDDQPERFLVKWRDHSFLHCSWEHESGQEKRAKFPTSKAPISAVFHSFRLIFGRAIISRNGLEAWALFPERARAAHSR